MSDLNTLAVFILLDRSGSMASRWDEALGAINAYVKELGEGEITLATFDHVEGLRFEVIRERAPAAGWKDVTSADATPRGGTPLFDAVARVIALADEAGREKTAIVVMTDGAENSSREVTLKDASAAVDRCKAKGWQVVFLGADFNAFAEAGRMGVTFDHTLNVASGKMEIGLRRMARHTDHYRKTGEAVSFTDEDREESGGK